MSDDDQLPQKKQGQDPTVMLFLALYLLLLAFFILLNSLSTLEEVRSKRVMDSLISAFASLIPPTTSPEPFTSQMGDVFNVLEAQQQLGELFTTAIPLAQVTVIQPGKQMYMRMHAEALFEPDRPAVRPGLNLFMDRLAASLAQKPAGHRYEMDVLLGTTYEPGNKLPERESLEVARAGTFARMLLERGAPKPTIRVGIKPSALKTVEFFFFFRADDEPVLDFEQMATQG